MDAFTLIALSAAAMLPPDAIVAAAERRAPQAIELFRDFLTLPNDAHSPDDLRRVLDWLHPQLAARGFRTSEIATGRIPLLFAERPGPDGAPTVLIYLQADGQPVDPAAWDQPSPWTPVLKSRGGDGRWTAIPWSRVRDGIDPDWRMFARSAADSKGPIVQFLSALDVIESTGATITHHLKVVIDTEEELGSPNLAAAVERERSTLAADFMLIFDGPPHASGRPSLVFGARGIATATLTVFGPAHALHSGHYGNYAPNPAMRLAQLLATMVDADGRVAIPGWYDGIELDAATRAQLDAVPDDDAAIRAHLGIASADALGTSLQHAVQWPSLNVRGLRSAWTGAEARTIVPSTATAELDIRLVPESDPQALLGALRNHIVEQGYTLVAEEPSPAERARHPRIARLDTSVSYPAFRTPIDSPVGEWLTAAMTRYHGRPPVRIRIAGGSVPIAPFVSTLGIPAVLVPTVNPDNNQHAPNENLRVGDFIDGIGVIAFVLSSPPPVAADYDAVRAGMLEAYGRGEYATADAHAARILVMRPNFPPTLLNRAVLAVLRGDAEAALRSLDRLARLGVHYDIADQEQFTALLDDARFTAAATRLEANAGTPAASEPAFTLPRPDFIPEGLAYDPTGGRLLVGSIRHREIVQVAADGAVAPFVAPASHGLGSVMGMVADPHRDRLWVASATTPQMRPLGARDETGIWEFRLGDGAFVARHMLPDAGIRQMIGDLTVSDTGRVFASDSRGGGVYEFDPAAGAFRELVAPGRLRSAQGLALSPDGKVLYVADYSTGLHAVDLSRGSLLRLRIPDTAHDYGVDGLYRHGRSLIAIQNLVAPHRVAEFTLADDAVTISGMRVLEAALPDYSEPTLGVIVDDALLYVANSQWNRFNDDGELPPPDELSAPVIRRLPLD